VISVAGGDGGGIIHASTRVPTIFGQTFVLPDDPEILVCIVARDAVSVFSTHLILEGGFELGSNFVSGGLGRESKFRSSRHPR